MATRRTAAAAERDDLAVLANEARRRGVNLSLVIREAVEREARRLRVGARPRFAIVSGEGTATRRIAGDEFAPARRRARSASWR